MRLLLSKKRIVSFLGILLSVALLTGCQYSSLDEYLELLGMKDSYQEESAQNQTSLDDSFVISEDSPVSADGLPPQDNDSAGDGIEADVIVSEESVTQGDGSEASTADTRFSSSYKQLTESELNDEMKAARENAGITDEGLERLRQAQQGLYAYERLTSSGKTLYVEILAILQSMSENVPVSTTSSDALDLVFNYVMIDHPEIFYVDGYRYTNYTIDDVVTKMSFSGNYTCSIEEAGRRQSLINQAVNECLAGAPSSTDDYYAIKYVYEYLIQNTEYDASNPDNQNICSVFIDKRSVCNGYAKAAQYLLNKLGIQCLLVTGTVDTKKARNVRHAWNMVLCNDTYYHFDATWGDSSYQVDNGESADATRLPAVNYDYLNVTTDEILRNHTISDDIYFPVCTSIKDNYYVREDEYFTSTEMALVKELFDRRYNDGSGSVVMKCASKDIYDSFFDQLITERGVFECMQGDASTVSYTTFEDTNTIIFWL
ncbi:MAG: hypothetical protein K6F75_04470 [Butyrivibrio sp.]|nr:hypothetical protein [Butyrivibrio sp.]